MEVSSIAYRIRMVIMTLLTVILAMSSKMAV